MVKQPTEWIEVTRTIPERTVRTLTGRREMPEHTVTEWHTKACLENTEHRKRLRIEYTSSWPYYCRRCGGWGGHWYQYDPSPPGVALSPGYMVDVDPCPLCCEQLGVCPRCGESLPEEFWENDAPCQHCGWSWYGGDHLGIPEHWECYCWSHPDYETGKIMGELEDNDGT